MSIFPRDVHLSQLCIYAALIHAWDHWILVCQEYACWLAGVDSADMLDVYFLDVFFANLPMKPWMLQDLKKKPKYLVTFTVGYEQRHNINAAVKKVIDIDYLHIYEFICISTISYFLQDCWLSNCSVVFWWFCNFALSLWWSD